MNLKNNWKVIYE